MASYSTSEFKPGLKLILRGEPYSIVENEFVKPGKGQAFNRVKLRNLKNGRILEQTFKSGESVEGADVLEKEMTYLYREGGTWYFMDLENYSQYAAAEGVMGDAKDWLVEQTSCTVTLWNDEPISVTPPNIMEIEIAKTDPGLKGDTVSGALKPATLVTGATVRVPLFLNEGDAIRVDTRTGEYQGRK